VSNNSAQAIRHYLTVARLDEQIHTVIGRATDDPARMKPDPAPVLAALTALEADPADAVFIGDTPADVDAGHAARVPVIGFANKPGKADRLAKADAIITSMADLVAALAPRDH
jgi:phosphoglycolate phosphatase-like HAD superfamily hydrolase